MSGAFAHQLDWTLRFVVASSSHRMDLCKWKSLGRNVFRKRIPMGEWTKSTRSASFSSAFLDWLFCKICRLKELTGTDVPLSCFTISDSERHGTREGKASIRHLISSVISKQHLEAQRK